MVSLSIDPPPSRPGRHQGSGPLKPIALAVAFVAAIGGGFVLGRYTAPAQRAASPGAEDARRVGFVDHEHRVEPFGQFGQLHERGQVAVHAE